MTYILIRSVVVGTSVLVKRIPAAGKGWSSVSVVVNFKRMKLHLNENARYFISLERHSTAFQFHGVSSEIRAQYAGVSSGGV